MFGAVQHILGQVTQALNVLASGDISRIASASTELPLGASTEVPLDAPLDRDGNWKYVTHIDNTRESIIEMKNEVSCTHKFNCRWTGSKGDCTYKCKIHDVKCPHRIRLITSNNKVFKYEKGSHSANTSTYAIRGIFGRHKSTAATMLKTGCSPAQVQAAYGRGAAHVPTLEQIKNYKRSAKSKRKTFSNNDIQEFFETHCCNSRNDYDVYEEDKLIALNTFAHNGKNNDGKSADNNKFIIDAATNYFILQVQ